MKKISINIITLLFCASLTSCYNWWDEKIPMDNVTDQSNLASFFYKAPEITNLEAPVQVIASNELYCDTIKLRWSEVDHAKSYRIERAVSIPDSNGIYTLPEEGDFSVIEKYIYKTTYNDTILTNASSSNEEYSYKYYYRICAENIGKGYESSPYTDITNPLTAAVGKLLPPPQNIDAWKGKSADMIQVKWESVPGSKFYNIYRSEKMKTGYELIATVHGNKNTYTDDILEADRGKEYYYKVNAELSNGSKSAYSSYALGYSLKDASLLPPQTITISNGNGKVIKGISLSWPQITVASGTLTYSVFRTSSADSTYTQIFSNLTSENIVDNSNLKSGIYYYYYIQCVVNNNGEISKSAFSDTGPDTENEAKAYILSYPNDCDIEDNSNPNMVSVK